MEKWRIHWHWALALHPKEEQKTYITVGVLFVIRDTLVRLYTLIRLRLATLRKSPLLEVLPLPLIFPH